MAVGRRQGRAYLKKTASDIADELRQYVAGTAVRVHRPGRPGKSDTDGWRAVIGKMRSGIRIEVWFDRFTRSSQRRFWFGFVSEDKASLRRLVKGVPRRQMAYRVFKDKDIVSEPFVSLCSRLKRDGFAKPIHEVYKEGWYFFGMYAATPESCSLAPAFIEAVVRRQRVVNGDVYSRCENRRVVMAHLARDRSQFLAEQCKARDGFRCRVCSMRFRDTYGEVGKGFAEAHHLVPLGRLKGTTKTRIDDLVTVCANCHRMLHRMRGETGDVSELQKSLRRRHGRGYRAR
jgi:hypothetical protein